MEVSTARTYAVPADSGADAIVRALAEIEMAVRLSLPVIVIVFNDAALSLIKLKLSGCHGPQPGAGRTQIGARYQPGA
jgi:thiamine pyrophosphate-dependent acetolactate synthase large subunit-like protein